MYLYIKINEQNHKLDYSYCFFIENSDFIVFFLKDKVYCMFYEKSVLATMTNKLLSSSNNKIYHLIFSDLINKRVFYANHFHINNTMYKYLMSRKLNRVEIDSLQFNLCNQNTRERNKKFLKNIFVF